MLRIFKSLIQISIVLWALASGSFLRDDDDFYSMFVSSQKETLEFILRSRTPQSFSDSSRQDPNLPTVEMNALKDFYVSTNGKHWKFPQAIGSIWNFTGEHNPCTELWAGVACTCKRSQNYTHFYQTYYYDDDSRRSDDFTCYVEKLFLVNVSATGLLPKSIGDFSLLSHLHLGWNPDLSGTIPDEITKLTQLQVLSLFRCSFSGKLPADLTKISLVRYLSISYNPITGSMPASLSALVNLEQLKLRGSYLAGPIISTIGTLAKLRVLRLSENSFSHTIPLSCSALTGLVTLDLYHNIIIGEFPSWIGHLRNLSSLYLTNNSLTGSLPSELSRLSAMSFLSLAYNRLHGYSHSYST